MVRAGAQMSKAECAGCKIPHLQTWPVTLQQAGKVLYTLCNPKERFGRFGAVSGILFDPSSGVLWRHPSSGVLWRTASRWNLTERGIRQDDFTLQEADPNLERRESL